MVAVVRVVDRDGTVLGSLSTLESESVQLEERLRGIPSLTFTCSLFDPVAVAHLPTEAVTCEVQLVEDGVVTFWGVPGPGSDNFDTGRTTFRCEGLESFYKRRMFGANELENLIENGGFEDWTAGAPDDWSTDGSPTVDEETSDTIEGGSALRITGTGNAAYVWQQDATGVDITYKPGLLAVLAGWVKVASLNNAKQLGQVLVDFRVDNGTDPNSPYSAQWRVNKGTQVGAWGFFSVPLMVAADVDWTAEARLYEVDGEVLFDKVRMVFDNAVTVVDGSDLALLFYNLVTYFQDTLEGFDDLQIDVTELAATDLNIPVYGRGFAHSNHEVAWQQAFARLMADYGVDFWIGVDRVAHLSTKRGERRDDLEFTIDGSTPSPEGARAESDPLQATTVMIARAESELFAREEAYARDTSAFGGLVLMDFMLAPNNVTPRGLDAVAEGAMEPRKRSGQVLTIPLLTDDPPGPGDVIPGTVDRGRAQYEGDWRVTRTVRNMRRPRLCTVDLIPDDGLPFPGEGS